MKQLITFKRDSPASCPSPLSSLVPILAFIWPLCETGQFTALAEHHSWSLVGSLSVQSMIWTDLTRTPMTVRAIRRNVIGRYSYSQRVVGGRQDEEMEKSWSAQITSWRKWGYYDTLMLTLLWRICIIIPKWLFVSMASKGLLILTCLHGLYLTMQLHI